VVKGQGQLDSSMWWQTHPRGRWGWTLLVIRCWLGDGKDI